MKRKKTELPFDPITFLAKGNGGQTNSKYKKGEIVYRQGDPGDSVFYVQSGKVKKTLLSGQGREAVVAIFRADDFFGERCLAGESRRFATAFTITECEIT